MSKQYKLLKWYPGLCRDWEVGMEVGIGDRGGDLYSPCSSKYTDACVIGSHVEKNSEYWQEIKQYKEPLFKDFLGNEVFEDRCFAMVQKGSYNLLFPARYYNYVFDDDGWIYFLHEHDAESYIDQNKPIYSKKQVLDALKYSQGWTQMEKMFKEKLGL